jgi:hypothetical protein
MTAKGGRWQEDDDETCSILGCSFDKQSVLDSSHYSMRCFATTSAIPPVMPAECLTFSVVIFECLKRLVVF